MKRRSGLFVLCIAIVCASGSTARATQFLYDAVMDGPSESPANASPGTGFGTAIYDNVAHTLSLSATFSGLTGTTTASHIHAPTAVPFAGTAGVATTTPSFAGFPLGVTSGAFANVLDLTQSTSWNPAYVTANGGTTAGAEAAFTAALAAGRAYWNIHSSTFPGGEIRGFMTSVPEPASAALIALGMASIGCLVRRKK